MSIDKIITILVSMLAVFVPAALLLLSRNKDKHKDNIANDTAASKTIREGYDGICLRLNEDNDRLRREADAYRDRESAWKVTELRLLAKILNLENQLGDAIA